MATGMIQPQTPNDSPPQADQSSGPHSAKEDTMRQGEVPPVATPPILTPAEIAENPEEKKLGFSAHNLAISDFTLLKTLGTGMRRLL